MIRTLAKPILILSAAAAAIMLVWLLYIYAIHPWMSRWGASQEETRQSLPGDEWTSNPLTGSTRAITIRAPAAEVWPWLVQMGADKGGLYSYTWIERMINCPITNADRIHPEWQALKPGDLVRMCPGEFGPPPYIVVDIQPERALIIGHKFAPGEAPPGVTWSDTWAFILQPLDDQTTRLIVRNRNALEAAWVRWIEPASFVMERGMLLGIHQRAEAR
jgi:hypothetical protein